MTAVGKTNLNTVPFDVTASILDDRTKIRDPRASSTRNNRRFVYDADPNIFSIDFSLFPYIVMGSPQKVRGKKSADRQTQEVAWTQTIKIHTLKDGSGRNRADAGREDMNNICDDIDQTFEEKAIFIIYAASNIAYMGITQLQPMTEILLGERLAYEVTYQITYRTRIEVA